MRTAKKSDVCLKIGLVLLLAGILLPAVSGQARQSAEKMPEDYPAAFSGQGCINQIAAHKVVIDDHLYKLSSDVTFNTPEMKNAPRSWFRSGRQVGFITNSKNEIVALWDIQKCR